MNKLNPQAYIDAALDPDSDITSIALRDEEGEIVAAAALYWTGDELHIASLGSKRKGYGSQLMRDIIGIANNRPISLLAEEPAVGFYKRFGFEVVRGESHAFEMRRLPCKSHTQSAACLAGRDSGRSETSSKLCGKRLAEQTAPT